MERFDSQRKFPRSIITQLAGRQEKIKNEKLKSLKEYKSTVGVENQLPEEMGERGKLLYNIQQKIAEKYIDTKINIDK